jgi:hypothetical protein
VQALRDEKSADRRSDAKPVDKVQPKR